VSTQLFVSPLGGGGGGEEEEEEEIHLTKVNDKNFIKPTFK